MTEEWTIQELVADGLALAQRVVEYFGTGPIDPTLDCDIEVRQMALDLLAKAQKVAAG